MREASKNQPRDWLRALRRCAADPYGATEGPVYPSICRTPAAPCGRRQHDSWFDGAASIANRTFSRLARVVLASSAVVE
jgi:hypothetical protein